jgi:hypothetical protein
MSTQKKKVKRSCSSFQLAVTKGVFITGNVGSLYFSFHQKWSKIGTLVQKEAEMKKKFKIFDSAPSYWT